MLLLMKRMILTIALCWVCTLGLSGCFLPTEALRDDPEEYRKAIGSVYITKTGFRVYRHPEDKYSREFLKKAEAYYSLYPSTENGHVNNRYSRLLGELPKGASLRVVSIVQGVDSKKIAYVVKIEESADEIMKGEEAIIRAYTERPALYVQDAGGDGLWDLSSRWFYRQED